MTPGNVAVAALGDETGRAEAFALARGLPFCSSLDEADAPYLLVFTGEWIELREVGNPGNPGGVGIVVDFSSIDLRTGAGNLSRKQPLAKAIGVETKTVVDATAGLGHDAVLLACMGYEVTAVERSPVIAMLFEDGLRRARMNETMHRELGERLQVVNGQACDVLESMTTGPEAVYIDPMFPPKRKKGALANKSIRLVRAIVGTDPDAPQLVEAAKRHARKRVIVKRPPYAQPLAGKPDLGFGGKLVRYDVYLTA